MPDRLTERAIIGTEQVRILAVDTATIGCSAAVRIGERLAGRRFETMVRGQSERLVPMIEATLAKAATATTDLDMIAVTIGPGAFTGLRIGLATARGMALALDLPCIGVTTTETIAETEIATAAAPVVVALDSKRVDLFIQVFSPGGGALGAPKAAVPDQLAEHLSMVPDEEAVVVIGDAADRTLAALRAAGRRCVLGRSSGIPDAASVAAVAARRWRPGDTPPPPDPLYLRPPDAVIPAGGGRLRP